jgi:UDP-N-acetylmuramate--alanine ligase
MEQHYRDKNDKMLGRTKKIHFVGIGGIGMSGIAEYLHIKGFEITGSDLTSSEVTLHLQKEGIRVFEGHHISNLDNVDVVVKSSAVKDDNPEVAFALHQKIPVIRRAEMLAELMRMSVGIGIAGTHGKTSSTSMVGMVLSAGGLEPTIIVGGKVMNFGSNNITGSGEYIVVEADEYDRSFLTLSPIIAAITNIEADHLDCYGNLTDIKDAFISFANKVPFFGCIICCLDDVGVQSILRDLNKNVLTYGFSRQADVRATNIRCRDFGSEFEVLFKEYNLGSIRLSIIGRHNIQNALLAVSVGIELNIPFEKIKQGLEEFKGVYRRCEYLGERDDIKFFDDYAHHPTEIMATLSGIRENTENRVVAIFQPHLFSRTRDFVEEFGRSFYHADMLIVVPIYPAREVPIPGITSQIIIDSAIQSGHNNTLYIEKNEQIVETIEKILKPGDIVITLGAGNINKYAKELYKK